MPISIGTLTGYVDLIGKPQFSEHDERSIAYDASDMSPEDKNALLAGAYGRTILTNGLQHAGGSLGPVVLRSGGAWGWAEIDTSRVVLFPGFYEKELASALRDRFSARRPTNEVQDNAVEGRLTWLF